MKTLIKALLLSSLALGTTFSGIVNGTSLQAVAESVPDTTSIKSQENLHSTDADRYQSSGEGHTQTISKVSSDKELDNASSLIVASRDDFKSEANYYDYLRTHPNVKTVDSIPTSKGAFASISTKNVPAAKEYTITGLESPNVVQKSYIGSEYIYTIQEKGDSDITLSRCLINGNTATKQDSMTLTEFGHSQTLEEFEHNGQYYFWIACGGTQKSGDYYWAREIGRLKYKAGDEIHYTEIPRISSISYANAEGQSLGPIERTDAALSSTTNRLMV